MAISRLARKLFWCATLMLLGTTVVTPCWAMSGYNYHDSTVLSLTTAYTDCGTSVPVANCWLNVQNAPLLETVAVNADNDIWGIETNGTSIVHFNASTQAWLIQPNLAGVSKLANSPDTTFALANGVVYKFTGSAWVTAFPAAPEAFTQIAVGVDDDFWALGTQAYSCGKQAYHFNASTQTWVKVANGVLSSISVGDANDVYGTACNNVYTFNPSNNTWVTVSGNLAQIAVAGQDRTENNGLPLVWGINSAGAAYHQDGTNWDAMTGTPSFIATGGEAATYGLFAGVLKHYSALRLNVMYHVYGNTGCGQTCANINHTTTSTINIQGYGPATKQLVAPAPNNIDVQTSITLTPLDSADCLFGFQDIVEIPCPDVSVNGDVFCPILGADAFTAAGGGSGNGGKIGPGTQYEFAHTYAIANANIKPYNCDEKNRCFMDTANNCNTATTPPDMDMGFPRGVDDFAGAWPRIEWNVFGICWRGNGTGIFAKIWSCLRGPAFIVPYNVPGTCTHNP